MENQLRDLERILNIPDLNLRRKELCDVARSLGMLPSTNPSAEGLSEHKIVLAIYDGLVQKKQQAQKNRKFFYIAFPVVALILFLIAVVPHSTIQYFRYLGAKHQKREKSFQGVDENGQVVRDEKGQPVLFRQMEGVYDEYYDDGALHFTYFYKEGKIREMTELDRAGNVLVHILYDEHGNTILQKK